MLLYFAGIIVQVMEQVSVLLIFIIIFSIYIKGTTTQDLYQSVLLDILCLWLCKLPLHYITLFYSWVMTHLFTKFKCIGKPVKVFLACYVIYNLQNWRSVRSYLRIFY